MSNAQLKPTSFCLAFGWAKEGATSWGAASGEPLSLCCPLRGVPAGSCSKSPPEAFTAARVVQSCTHLWEPEKAEPELNFRGEGSSASLNNTGPREGIKCYRRKRRGPALCSHPVSHPAAGSWGCLLPRGCWPSLAWPSGLLGGLLGLSLRAHLVLSKCRISLLFNHTKGL